MPLTTISIEVIGVGSIVEFDGPAAPRGRIRTKSDAETVDLIEEQLARLRRIKSPAIQPELEPAPPTNFAPAITRRSRTWARQKEETPS